jgi:hypothetical protein
MKRYARITNILTGEFEDEELNEKQLALFPLKGSECRQLTCEECPLGEEIEKCSYKYRLALKGGEFHFSIKIELLPLFEPTEQDIMNCKTIGDLPNGVYCHEMIFYGEWRATILLKTSTFYFENLKMMTHIPLKKYSRELIYAGRKLWKHLENTFRKFTGKILPSLVA